MNETGAAPVEAGAAPDSDLWSAPRLWPGETVFILGGGPSLRTVDVSRLAGRRCIALNDSWKLIRDADVLLAPDRRWWRWNEGAKLAGFRGQRKVTTQRKPPNGVLLMQYGGRGGLSLDPWCLKGRNAGHQGINLAYHLAGPTGRAVLLGFDQKPDEAGATHWHEGHRIPTDPAQYQGEMTPEFETLVEPLRDVGFEVLNATIGSALECFPKIKLWRVL